MGYFMTDLTPQVKPMEHESGKTIILIRELAKVLTKLNRF